MALSARSKPQNSSGRRESGKLWAASKIALTRRFASSWKPYRFRPAAAIDVSCGQTVPV